MNCECLTVPLAIFAYFAGIALILYVLAWSLK